MNLQLELRFAAAGVREEKERERDSADRSGMWDDDNHPHPGRAKRRAQSKGIPRQRNVKDGRQVDCGHDCTAGGSKANGRASQEPQIELQITVNPEMISGPQRACCYGNFIIAGTAVICGSLLN